MTTTTAGPVEWVGSALLPWLDDPDRDSSQLARWLAGYDLAPVGHADEPYLWLLRALPRGSARPPLESALAQSAAELLARAPKVREQPEADRLLYNLLNLAAGLRGRDSLSAPLLDLLQSNLLDEMAYDAITLNSVLLLALVHNQRDNALQRVWETMSQGKPDPIVGGNPVDAFQGILHMPPSAAERGTPALESIGSILTHLLKFVEARPNRVALLRSYFGQLQSRYPGHDWARELIHFSHVHEWNRWTDVALPDLAIALGGGRYLVWQHVKELMGKQIEAMDYHSDGRICEVEVPEMVLDTFVAIAQTVEKYRRRIYFGGEQAEQGLISSVCEELNRLFAGKESACAAASISRVSERNVQKVFAAARL